MNANEIAKQYVALFKEGKYEACLDSLFAKNAESVEAGGPPGVDRTSKGLETIRAKGRMWRSEHEIHKAEVWGPYPNDDRFAVRFLYDLTDKPSGKRIKLDEVALLTIADGKIVREEFFYSMS